MGETSKAWRTDKDFNGNRLPFDPLVLIAVVVGVPALLLFAGVVLYRIAFDGRIYLGVTAGNVELQAYTQDEARDVLVARFRQYAATPIKLRFEQQEWQATPAEMGMRFDVEDTVRSAYEVGRSGGLLTELAGQLGAFRRGEAARKPVFQLDAAQRDGFFQRIAAQVNRQPIDAHITLAKSEYKARISASQPGRTLNVEKTARKIEDNITSQSSAPIDLVVDLSSPKVADSDLQPIKDVADRMMSAPLVAQFEDQSWKIERDDIAELLSVREQPAGSPKAVVDIADQPLARLSDKIAKTVDRPPLNARFSFTNGNLKVIRDGVDGRTVDIAATVAAIKQQLASDQRNFALPVKVAKPPIGSGDANKLRIEGVIEEDSTEYGYGGALPERVYNVELAASRLNGVVVAPGATFSFNDEVGAVNTLAGYKVGFGITQQGGNAITVESVGGGICQVATTLFHPVFWAGYPIGDRVPHLYWIPRYGIAPKGLTGLDTTVDQIYNEDGSLGYAVDFTFKNTSPNPILIQSKTDGKKVTFTLLGVKPTWQVKVDGPVIGNVVPNLKNDERQENPDWPAGKTVMIEEARDGFKSTIVRTVTQDGKVVSKQNFVSNYQPTRNVVMVGTKGATPSPTAAPGTPVPSRTPSAGATPAARTTPVSTPAPTPAPTAPATPAPTVAGVVTPVPTTVRR